MAELTTVNSAEPEIPELEVNHLQEAKELLWSAEHTLMFARRFLIERFGQGDGKEVLEHEMKVAMQYVATARRHLGLVR